METLFYLANVFEGLQTVACIFLILGIIVAGIGGMLCFIYQVTKTDDLKNVKFGGIVRDGIICGLIGMFMLVFSPDKQTYLFMKAGSIIDYSIKQNPEIKNLPGNTLNLLNEYIQVETQKLRENKNNK